MHNEVLIEMFPKRRIIRIILYCLASTLVFLFIFYKFSGDQPTELIGNQIKDNYYPGRIIDLAQNTKKKQLPLPKIIKLGGDSSNLNRSAEKYHQNLGACKIPKLTVDGAEVIKFYKKYAPLNCKRGKPEPWVYIDDDRRVRTTEFARNEIGLEKINCSWTYYDRLNDRRLVWTGEENFIFGDTMEKGDFVKINCKTNDAKWSNPFMVAVPKPKRVEQLRSALQKRQNWNASLNVYILSFDSISQMSFRRNLPKTVNFLENEMNSIVLNGYNIVGDGTPQAFIPILTGQTEEELPLTRKRYLEARYVDEVYPFVWNNFSDAGYATLYGEDGHGLGTFTYRLKGFRSTPTDHFPITFFHYTESLKSSAQCIGAEKQHVVWFRYIESFWREYAKLGLPRFSLMHHSFLSHDDINRIQQADEDMAAHLRKMKEMGAFEDSLLIVMADHGARFSELRQTQQERLPFFSVHFPNSTADERYQLVLDNLRKNALDRLATPFDVHATLLDIIRWPTLSQEEIKLPNKLPNGDLPNGKKFKIPPNRSLSLLREIPLWRTCDQAGIEPHWCTCLSWLNVTNSDESEILANAVIVLINEYTESERALCSPLTLHKVISAKKLVPNEDLLKYSGIKDKDGFVAELKGNAQVKFATYQIVFETTPANARYEVTLFYDGKQVTVDWSAISHISKYGDTPHCIIDKNYFMASYCVCYDKIF